MGQVKGSGEGAFSPFPFPLPLSFFRPRTNRKGYYFYSPQSSTVIKSTMAATTILRTRTRFRLPKIRLHCRLKFTVPLNLLIDHDIDDLSFATVINNYKIFLIFSDGYKQNLDDLK